MYSVLYCAWRVATVKQVPEYPPTCRATCINSGTYRPQQTVFPPTIHSTSTTGVCTQRPQVPPSSPKVKRLRGNFRSTSTFSPFIHLPLPASQTSFPVDTAPSFPDFYSSTSSDGVAPHSHRLLICNCPLSRLSPAYPTVHAASFADLLPRSLRILSFESPLSCK